MSRPKNIRSGTITFTFLFNETINSTDEVNAMSMDDILYECSQGHMVGQVTGDYKVVPVNPAKVENSLLRLDNDGTFFDNDEDGEDE